MAEPKKKYRHYGIECLNYGFLQSPINNTLPMCVIWQNVLLNKAVKASRPQEYFDKNSC